MSGEGKISFKTVCEAASSDTDVVLDVAVVDAALRQLAALVERAERMGLSEFVPSAEQYEAAADLCSALAAGFDPATEGQ